MNAIDWQAINQSLLCHVDSLLSSWFPLGKVNGNQFFIGDIQGNAGSSLTVNRSSGIWKDFKTGESGRDLISLYAAKNGINNKQAAEQLSVMNHNSKPNKNTNNQKKLPFIIPVPEHAPNPSFCHPKHGKPSLIHPYRDSNNKLLGFTCRFDISENEKIVLPYACVKNKDNSLAWKWQSFGKHAYGLETINNDKPIIIVEGEKTCDAARKITQRYNFISWLGGASTPSNVDWSILAGRIVYLFPDADEVGIKAMNAINEIVSPIAQSVKITNPPSDVEKGWDLADFYEEGGNEEGLEKLINPPKKIIPVNNNRIPHMPFTLLGCNGDLFYYIADTGQQIVSLTASSHTKYNLLRLASISDWEREFPNKIGCEWDEAVNTLIQKNIELPLFDGRRIRGRGSWIDGNDIIYHAGNKLIVNNSDIPITHYHSQESYIYEGRLKIDTSTANPASNNTSIKLIRACELISWEKPLFAKLFAGWLAIAPICGALRWRPHIWLTGAAGTGKSWIYTNFVKQILGDCGFYIQGETTAPAISRQLAGDALPVLFDEAESKTQAGRLRLNQIMELATQASCDSGDGIFKCDTSGGTVSYLVRSSFLFSSVGVAAVDKTHTSRITVLTLQKGNTEQFEALKSYCLDTLFSKQFVDSIRSRTMNNIKAIRANFETFSDVVAAFLGDKRAADQLGALLAGAYSLHTTSLISKEDCEAWVKAQDWEGFRPDDIENDESQCLAYLFGSIIKYDSGSMNLARSIDETITSYQESVNDLHKRELNNALMRHGMKIDGNRLHIANNHVELERIFRDTQWSGSKWKDHLGRLPDAEKHKPSAFLGKIRQRTVSIPI